MSSTVHWYSGADPPACSADPVPPVSSGTEESEPVEGGGREEGMREAPSIPYEGAGQAALAAGRAAAVAAAGKAAAGRAAAVAAAGRAAAVAAASRAADVAAAGMAVGGTEEDSVPAGSCDVWAVSSSEEAV